MFQTKDVQGKGSKFLKVFQGFLGDPGIFVQKRLFCAHIDVNRKKKKKKKKQQKGKRKSASLFSPFCPYGPTPTPVKRGDFRASALVSSPNRLSGLCAQAREW